MRYTKFFLFFALFFLSVSCGRRTFESDAIVMSRPPLLKSEVIVIDAGHGGKDAGTCSQRFNYQEKALTLSTAKMLKDYLNQLGYTCLLTREGDEFIPLKTRAEIANERRGALFISLHYNHAPDSKAEGIEIFYFKDEKGERQTHSRRLGEEVLSRLLLHTGASSRGVKTANFAVIRETQMPAILIEGGFLSNPHEREKLSDPQYIRYLAWGVAKGIDQYLEKSRKYTHLK